MTPLYLLLASLAVALYGCIRFHRAGCPRIFH